ncbi:MAG: NAD(P)H-hydrate dehydratase [Chthoniobacterales bacterium]|jgi:NAD(P)H-hydrate epimerase|nr:NAD(P)H-hydrate dehydratase [Chthoniobacterales bacterium]
MILSRQRMLQVEQQTISRGIPADLLMESAGAKLARCASQFFPRPGLVVCYAGKGHNAGDALVAARHLAAAGWRVLVRSPFHKADLAPLTREKLEVLGADILQRPLEPSVPLDGPLLLLDALVGLGTSGHLREPIATLALEMNALRRMAGARTLAVDFPSGLDPETGEPGDPCVQADITATVGFAKNGLVADAATDFVGRIAVLGIPEFGEPGDGGPEVLTAPLLRRHWPPRVFDTNKGMCGRVVLLAGSRGMLGAAHLCAAGAVRAGAGLVSLGATADHYELLAATAIPEVMVRPFKALTDVFTLQVDAIGIGPGLGSGREAHTLRVVREAACPAVIDADALTIVAHAGLQHLHAAVAPRLLTPHPGEMQRLLAGKKIKDRARTASDFVRELPVTLLLKGARTVIAQKNRPLRFNTTGNPGMAAGGMGDVLTGVCTALLGQHADTYLAASIGAWVCGRAAEIAVIESGASEESLTPGEVLANLGRAFDSLRAGDF